MTEVSYRFAARMLRNACNVMRRQHEELMAGPTGKLAPPPLYGFDDVEALDHVVEKHQPGVPIQLGHGVTAVFWDAGHIPGAAGVLLDEGPGGKTFFYTGDTCGGAQLLLPGATYPTGPIDTLLTESTYGGNPAADATQREDVAEAFCAAVAKVVARGGRVLAPVFALGRAQEILFALWRAGRQGRLPSVPIYMGGLAVALSRLYDETRHDSPRVDPTLRLSQLGFLVLDERAIADGAPGRPSVALASSGMMQPKTFSNRLARDILVEEDAALFIVGYQDPDSAGYRVQHSRLGEPVDLGDGLPPVIRRCALERFHFSGHSKRIELVRAAAQMQPRQTVVVHGDPGGGASLGDTFREAGSRVTLPEPCVPYDL